MTLTRFYPNLFCFEVMKWKLWPSTNIVDTASLNTAMSTIFVDMAVKVLMWLGKTLYLICRLIKQP